MTPEEENLFRIFFPYASSRQLALQQSKAPLVHYTSAEAAMNIIQSKEFWMRESSCMNDYSEGAHGINCVSKSYNETQGGAQLREALNQISPTITKEIENLFNRWKDFFVTDTYLACFSEHDFQKENSLGRLSMWRAYSEKTGVAIVLNSTAFFNESDHFEGLYTSPVAYLDDSGFENELTQLARNIISHSDQIKTLQADELISYTFRVLMFASLCTKHPGFKEEQEWRLTYCPSLESTPNLIKDHQKIKGVPQIIYKIPLKNVPQRNLVGLELSELINRIIIGPTTYPLAMKKAFIDLLDHAGVKNAAEKVTVSGIPLRT